MTTRLDATPTPYILSARDQEVLDRMRQTIAEAVATPLEPCEGCEATIGSSCANDCPEQGWLDLNEGL